MDRPEIAAQRKGKCARCDKPRMAKSIYCEDHSKEVNK